MPSHKHRHPAPKRKPRKSWRLRRPTVVRISRSYIPRNLREVLRAEEEGFLILRVS